MKYPLAQKAYSIDYSEIEEGFLSSGNTCYAETHNRARVKLLAQIKDQGWCLLGGHVEVNYINIPVKRDQLLDKYHFENEQHTMHEIEQILAERERLQKFEDYAADPKIQYCYIRKNGMYYRSGWAGYTDFVTKAGVYDKKEAISHAKGVREIVIVPIDPESHNAAINKEIEELKQKLIL